MTVQRYQHDTKKMPCRCCGDPVEVGVRTRKEPRCYTCGLKAAIDAARQMHLKAGPYYDNWVTAMKRARAMGRWGTPSEVEAEGVQPRV